MAGGDGHTRTDVTLLFVTLNLMINETLPKYTNSLRVHVILGTSRHAKHMRVHVLHQGNTIQFTI